MDFLLYVEKKEADHQYHVELRSYRDRRLAAKSHLKTSLGLYNPPKLLSKLLKELEIDAEVLFSDSSETDEATVAALALSGPESLEHLCDQLRKKLEAVFLEKTEKKWDTVVYEFPTRRKIKKAS